MHMQIPVTLNGTAQALDGRIYLGTWEVRDDEIVMTDPRVPVSGDTGGIGLGVRASGDFNLECEFILDKARDAGAGGPVISFYAQPDGAHYDFRYVSYFNAGVLQKKTVGQPWQEIGYAADVALPESVWHALKLTVRGDTFSVSVNGQEIVSARDASFSAGQFGLGCTVRPVRYRNVRMAGGDLATAPVWSPPGDTQIRVICADAGMGGYQGFPSVCRLQDGDLLCAFYAGWGHTAASGEGQRPNGGAVALCRSTDDGNTWSPATIVFDGPFDDNGVNIWQYDDGTVRMAVYSIDHQAWPTMQDYFHYYSVTSNDGGRTWSEIATMQFGDMHIGAYSPWSSPYRLANGEWLWPVYWAGGAAGSHCTQWVFHAGFSRSVDGGHTWGQVEYIEAQESYMNEGDLCQFPDGSIICIVRDERQHMWQTWSRDDGHTWSAPAQLPWYGHCPNLLRTRSGITLLVHRVPGVCVRYSLDDAKTWAGAVMIDSAGGAYSSMVELEDGRVLITYYTEGDRSQIRAQVLDVSATGIRSLDIASNKR